MIKRKSEITKMSILIEIMHGKKKIKEIANSVNITIQGVSEYIKLLKREGYIDKNMNITNNGTEFVYKKIEELRTYVTNIMSDMKIIKSTEAIAGDDINANESVGLFMENGHIYAYKKESKSKGIASYSAKKGEDLNVENLEGILDLTLGKITVVRLPSSRDGGSRNVDPNDVSKIVKGFEKIGIIGEVALITLKKSGIKPDFEFGVVKASREAAHKGFSTVIFVSTDLFKYVIDDLELESPGLAKIPYNIIDLSNVRKKY
ncbi:MAG: winged helix-turn-helix transcriptional regulator [Thermoplasmata archaeon]